MHPTSHDLSSQTRQAVCGILQAQLVDAIDLSSHLKQAHWTMRGPNFIGLHTLLDTLYTQVSDQADMVAERIAALGGQAEGTVDVSAKDSRLPRYPLNIVSPSDHIETLSRSLAAYGKTAREGINASSDAGDEGTADLFTEIVRAADKSLWLIEAHKPVA